MRKCILRGIFLALSLFVQSALAQIPWPEWVVQLKQEAISQGISATLLDQLFTDMNAPQQKILGLASTQPEHRLNYYQYLNTRASQDRIAMGKKEYRLYSNILNAIAQKYAVDPSVIVALWGMETSYGHFMGTFPTIQALATLAYESNRPDVFRAELLDGLHMLNDGHVTIEQFKGEWAGASGQCQFLPSSWYKYAVDYNNDGKKDIWSSVPDVLASIANYLHLNGWQKDQPIVIVVQLPAGFSTTYVQTREIKTVRQWASLGITQTNGQPLPASLSNAEAFVVNPDGGPVWLALNNFKVILTYNNSIYYAGVIDYMAEHIAH